MIKLHYPLFDGEKIWAGACVTIDNGLITDVQPCDAAQCAPGFLMPGFVDAHVHMETEGHVAAMLRHGVTTVCDVCAPQSLIAASTALDIVSSAGMAMGVVMNPKGYVEKAAESGAKYIKVLLFNALSIGKPALCGIVKAAHANGLKVAVHATELATVKQAVAAQADILLHVPMKEAFPADLAQTIADEGIAVAPTLVMMDAFAHSGRNGYQPSDYQRAEAAVRLLRDSGVRLLVGTDANPGSFAPGVSYGDSLHEELRLLVQAGLTPLDVLQAATSRNADTFSLHTGRIAPGLPATMLLLDGRPDQTITDSQKIRRMWVKGEVIA